MKERRDLRVISFVSEFTDSDVYQSFSSLRGTGTMIVPTVDKTGQHGLANFWSHGDKCKRDIVVTFLSRDDSAVADPRPWVSRLKYLPLFS